MQTRFASRLDELVILLLECCKSSELTGWGQDKIRRVTRDTHDPLHCPWRVDVELDALLPIRKERDVVVSSNQRRRDDVGDLLLDDGARALVGIVCLDHRSDIVVLARVTLDNGPTGTVAIARFNAVSITETVLSPVFATYTLFPFGVTARPSALNPTGTTSTTMFCAVSITDTELLV